MVNNCITFTYLISCDVVKVSLSPSILQCGGYHCSQFGVQLPYFRLDMYVPTQIVQHILRSFCILLSILLFFSQLIQHRCSSNQYIIYYILKFYIYIYSSPLKGNNNLYMCLYSPALNSVGENSHFLIFVLTFPFDNALEGIAL